MKQRIGHIATTRPRGSALILTVVLTSLLAIVGVLFVMASRIDKMSTTAAAETRELTFAVDTVLAQIDQALMEDVPGPASNPNTVAQEYYDFPDALNPWLADLEPYASDGKYYWRQISNLVGPAMVRANGMAVQVAGERDAIDPNLMNDPNLTTADADGDGVGDARWFQVPGVMTSKGRPFYAAVRIVDNGAMLNVNTGFQFDPNGAKVDGASQLQVNVLALAAAPGAQPRVRDANSLLAARANNGVNPAAAGNLDRYERDVIWQYMDVKNPGLDNPSPYTPFDISDELELRYRFLLNQQETDTRIEAWGRFRLDTISVPVEYAGNSLRDWRRRAAGGPNDAFYSYRHLATTYSMDRIITPAPLNMASRSRKMVNVNTADEDTLQTAIAAALDEANPDANAMDITQRAAQITANLRDYIDDDDEVTVIGGMSSPFYGFERPCIYISEIACRQAQDAMGNAHSSCAIELYKPYFEDRDPSPDAWQLVIHHQTKSGESPKPDTKVSITWSGSRRFHVILAEDSQTPLAEDYIQFLDPNEPVDTLSLYGYNRADYAGTPQELDPSTFAFEPNALIYLQRVLPGGGELRMDRVKVPGGWIEADGTACSLQRDISTERCIRRLWATAAQRSTPALGNAQSNWVDMDPNQSEPLQAHPTNKPLTNIGELGMIFRESVYSMATDSPAVNVLLDLADPNYARLFNYLTVIDPARWRGADETRVAGRININTAPAMVLGQLPWLRYREGDDYARATDIVNYRVRNGESHPYRSIADLMQIPSMRMSPDKLDNQLTDTPRGPDLTPDTAQDDLEERDLLFTRISDLVTVRSDVFTAYILVRIGESGPQRRIVAIFDRSGVISGAGGVRLIAQQLVPDPR
ncbi:MAG: hypothetical protein ABFD90_12090 [Phycisphaerales bacterium]